MFLKSELLDRMELLYPYDLRFANLRRAYIDRDLSSIFRVLEDMWDTSFDDVRLAIMEKELHSLFRLWEQHPHIREDLRKAMLEDNMWSLFRLFDPEYPNVVNHLHLEEEGFDPQDFKKVVMNDNTWSLYRMLLHFQDSQIVNTIKSFHANGTRINKNALSRGQIQSKMWLIDELKTLDLELGTVFLCAGWYGILATLLFEHDFDIDSIRSFDIDPECVDVADKFNLPWFSDEWRFKALTEDIHKINYSGHQWTSWSIKNNRPSRPIRDVPNTIINTSCEHIHDFSSWYDKIPAGKYIVLQSNNYHDVAEHVNLSESLEEFAAQTPMHEVLYEGELPLEKYTRWMRIGIK
jgi:hypothetical protein